MGKITKPKASKIVAPAAAAVPATIEKKTAGLAAARPAGAIKKKKAEKRKEKHEKLVQKLQAAADLTKKKEKETKEKAQIGTLGMSSLSELLDSLMEKEEAMRTTTKNKKMDNKMKQKMAVTELEQFKNVLAHPAFQSDPLGTIKEHLKNKVAAVNIEREAANPRKVVPRHMQQGGNNQGKGSDRNTKRGNIQKGGKGRK